MQRNPSVFQPATKAHLRLGGHILQISHAHQTQATLPAVNISGSPPQTQPYFMPGYALREGLNRPIFLVGADSEATGLRAELRNGPFPRRRRGPNPSVVDTGT